MFLLLGYFGPYLTISFPVDVNDSAPMELANIHSNSQSENILLIE
jgi:hypothetical protein